MYKVYALRSNYTSWFYIGLTQDILRRVNQHNKGFVKSTKSKLPLTLVFQRSFKTRIEARDFEKYLKIRFNKEQLLRSLGFL